MSVNHECLPAIAITLLPNVGFFVSVDLTEDNGRWYSTLEHPSWGVTTGELYFPILLAVNFIQGYAAFLTWEAGGRSWTTLPMCAYEASLFFFWIHFPVFLGCRSLKWGTVDITLALCSAVGTTLLFFNELPTAGYLMIPHVCLLTYDTLRYSWIYFKNRSGAKRVDESVGGGGAK